MASSSIHGALTQCGHSNGAASLLHLGWNSPWRSPRAHQSLPERDLFAVAAVWGQGRGVKNKGERHVVHFGGEHWSVKQREGVGAVQTVGVDLVDGAGGAGEAVDDECPSSLRRSRMVVRRSSLTRSDPAISPTTPAGGLRTRSNAGPGFSRSPHVEPGAVLADGVGPLRAQYQVQPAPAGWFEPLYDEAGPDLS